MASVGNKRDGGLTEGRRHPRLLRTMQESIPQVGDTCPLRGQRAVSPGREEDSCDVEPVMADGNPDVKAGSAVLKSGREIALGSVLRQAHFTLSTPRASASQMLGVTH